MSGSNRYARRLKLGRGSTLIALSAVAVLVLAACGGSSKNTNADAGSTGGGGSSTSSTPLTGAPIKTMTLAAVNYNGPNYANILTTAKLYEKWINAHGGIKGHPLEVTVCDEQGDPNKTAKCGRDAVANKAVAVIGSYTLNGDSILPELAAAKTSWFGICCAATGGELQNPIVQQLGSGGSYAGLTVKAVADGCKNIDLVLADTGASADLLTTIVKNALKSANGPELHARVLIPLTAQDYSAQVAQATDGTDCILGVIAESAWAPFLTAYASSGGTQRLYGPQGNLDQKIISKFPKDVTEGAVVVGSYSDLTLPVWADYNAAIKQYDAPKDQDYNSLGGLGTWAAYVAFNNIASTLTDPTDPAAFLAAAQVAKVDLKGMVAPVDFAAKFTGLGSTFLNDVNRTGTFDIVKDGKLVPFKDGAFYDFTNAMVGKPLAPENLPPAGQ
ncbi:MAG: putative lipoprotein [Frankiales bacterium]|nr:putative lipoprotein [Frankiales bacterium]